MQWPFFRFWLFMLLVLELVVVGAFGAFSCPNEPTFVQKSLLVWWHFVTEVSCPLVAAPLPQRLVLLAVEWHHAMAILLFKFELNDLSRLLVSDLVVDGLGGVTVPRKPISSRVLF
jgi:hypothetical protein